mgnify:CR=1 FL=1
MTSTSETGAAVRQYRLAMRGTIVLAALTLVLAIAGTRGWVPARLGLLSAAAFLVSLGLILRFGLRAHRQLVADRERKSHVEMILIIAGQLCRQDDAQLEEIVTRGGLAAEAATMLLQGRRERKRPG